jgi:hypothetical protein
LPAVVDTAELDEKLSGLEDGVVSGNILEFQTLIAGFLAE